MESIMFNKYETVLKHFVIGVQVLIAINMLIWSFVFPVLTYLYIICFVVNAVTFVSVLVIPIQYVMRLAPFYSIFFILFLCFWYAISVAFSLSLASLIYILVIPSVLSLIFPWKKTLKYAIFILICVALVKFVSPFFDLHLLTDKIQPLSIEKVSIHEKIALLGTFIFILYLIYYKFCFQRLQDETIVLLTAEQGTHDEKLLKKNDKKIDKLYEQIIKYFDTKQPYLDSAFSLAVLAKEMESNVVYISQAINRKANMNYVTFVNSYRIRKAQEIMTDKNIKRYSLHYIYSASGFATQSAFNYAFKQVEGITPSEFIKRMKQEAQPAE